MNKVFVIKGCHMYCCWDNVHVSHSDCLGQSCKLVIEECPCIYIIVGTLKICFCSSWFWTKV